ncbi:MAG: helix-hairpin-helix domain-containing protein [Planctomycetota bacterium]|nr:helix-hairpin-helix domain-containing protein [Planctomycetota bacterium]
MEPVGTGTSVRALAGPAKWAAVSIVAGLAGAGLTYSLVTRGPDPQRVERPAGAFGELNPPVSPPGVIALPPPAPSTVSPPAPVQQVPPTPPPVGDAPPDASAPAVVAAPAPVPAAPAPSGRLNINRATQAELELLPGIGPAMARAILEHRAAHGPFRSITDLDKVRGIGPKTLERLAPLVTVD